MLHHGDAGGARGRSARLVRAVGAVGVGAAAVAFLNADIIDLPDWFEGGRSDPAPRRGHLRGAGGTVGLGALPRRHR